MKRILIMLISFVVSFFILHYVAIGLYHVETAIKPYTDIGKVIAYWGAQVVALIASLLIGLFVAFRDA